jgi:hypothetical protein
MAPMGGKSLGRVLAARRGRFILRVGDMKIINVNLSPLPRLIKMEHIKLTLTQGELFTLRQAAKILEKAESQVEQYYKKVENYPENFSLSDIDFDMSKLFCCYEIDEFLETYSNNQGIVLEYNSSI